MNDLDMSSNRYYKSEWKGKKPPNKKLSLVNNTINILNANKSKAKDLKSFLK